MRTHTLLSTPPGQEPEAVSPVRASASELYVPGLAIPREPRPPGRYRTPVLAVGGMIALVLVAITAWWVVTSGQTFDPSLDNVPTGPSDGIQEQDPTLELPDDPTLELPDGGEGGG